MLCRVFDTEVEALQAEKKLINNIRSWVSSHSPDALSDDNKLRGRRASDHELVDVFTVKWAIPAQRHDGKWFWEEPLANRVAPIPLESVTEGVGGVIEEFQRSWITDQLDDDI